MVVFELKIAVAFQLITNMMKGKELFKKIFYGKLITFPLKYVTHQCSSFAPVK